MEIIQENICKQACSYVFVQENYIKAHVLMYFLHLVLTFTPHYIIMVKGLLYLPRGITAFDLVGSPNDSPRASVFACWMSFPEREELPHVHRVGNTSPPFLKYLYSVMIIVPLQTCVYHRLIIHMHVGGKHYVTFYYWRDYNLAIFYDLPNHQIKILAKFSRYTVIV